MTANNDRTLERLLERMPYEQPPADLTANIMAGLKPHRPGLWRRIMGWLTSPVEFRVRPVVAVPALAALLLVVGAVAFLRGAENEAALNGQVPVRFVLAEPGDAAHSVSVIGSFNDWKGQGFEMRYDPELRVWTATVPLPPGVHEYVFLLDGRHVMADPRARLTRDDGFGNKNSLLYVDRDATHDL